MIELERTLAELGDLLDVDELDVESLIAELEASPSRPDHGRRWLAVAAVALLVALGVVAIAPARQTVARWLGFERLDIEIDPTLDLPLVEPSVDEPTAGEGGTEQTPAVIVSEIDATLSEISMTKTVAAGGDVVMVDVDGKPGLWFANPHLLVAADGDRIVEQRIAGRTLVWQDGDVLRRVEGFETVDEAVAYAEALDG